MWELNVACKNDIHLHPKIAPETVALLLTFPFFILFLCVPNINKYLYK